MASASVEARKMRYGDGRRDSSSFMLLLVILWIWGYAWESVFSKSLHRVKGSFKLYLIKLRNSRITFNLWLIQLLREKEFIEDIHELQKELYYHTIDIIQMPRSRYCNTIYLEILQLIMGRSAHLNVNVKVS